MKRNTLAVLLFCAVAALVPGLAGAAVGVVTGNDAAHNNTPYVDFTNVDGTWRIYLACGSGAGPGYVAKMTTANQVLVDDTQPVPTFSDGGRGVSVGIGKFVFRHARAGVGAPLHYASPSSGGNAWDYDGRECNNVDVLGVNGASSHAMNGTPSYDPSSDTGSLDYEVDFQDPWKPDFLKVIYRWRFHATNVQLWADVIENCNNGVCGSAGAPPAWIKGPKFLAGVRNTGKKFTQITVWGGGKALCAAAAANPGNATGQCSAAARSRFQFNYAIPKTLSGGGYDPAQPARCTDYVDGCFSAVFESLLPDNITYQSGSNGVTPGNLVEPWYNGTGGMNNWANDMDYQQAESTATNCNGNVLPSSQERWESVGDKLTSTGARGTYQDAFTDASGFAFGWEDCTTVESAQSLYRAYENEGMDYGTYASFGFAGHYITAG